MRNLDSQERHYSANEIAEILRLIGRKNALGISFEELASVERALKTPPPSGPAAPAAPQAPVVRPAWKPVKAGVYPVGPRREEEPPERFCSKCESPMALGRWGKFYCKVCYMDRKAAKESR